MGNVIIPSDPWSDHVMELIANCINSYGSSDENALWKTLADAMKIESKFRPRSEFS